MTVRSLIVSIVFISVTPNAFSQSLFFDHLNNSTWMTEKFYNDSTLGVSPEIGLHKVRSAADSVGAGLTVWRFKNDVVTISNHKSSTRSTYSYKADQEKGLLTIYLKDTKPLVYNVGIVSTGSFVLLTRKKNKK